MEFSQAGSFLSFSSVLFPGWKFFSKINKKRKNYNIDETPVVDHRAVSALRDVFLSSTFSKGVAFLAPIRLFLGLLHELFYKKCVFL